MALETEAETRVVAFSWCLFLFCSNFCSYIWPTPVLPVSLPSARERERERERVASLHFTFLFAFFIAWVSEWVSVRWEVALALATLLLSSSSGWPFPFLSSLHPGWSSFPFLSLFLPFLSKWISISCALMSQIILAPSSVEMPEKVAEFTERREKGRTQMPQSLSQPLFSVGGTSSFAIHGYWGRQWSMWPLFFSDLHYKRVVSYSAISGSFSFWLSFLAETWDQVLPLFLLCPFDLRASWAETKSYKQQ